MNKRRFAETARLWPLDKQEPSTWRWVSRDRTASSARALILTYTRGEAGGGGVQQVSRKINIVPQHCIKKQPTNKFIQVSRLYLYIFIDIFFSSLKCLTQSSELGGGLRGRDPPGLPPFNRGCRDANSGLCSSATPPSSTGDLLPPSIPSFLHPSQVNTPVPPISIPPPLRVRRKGDENKRAD